MSGAGTGTQASGSGVAAAANALVSLAEQKEWLGIDSTETSMDDFLQRAINDWSDRVESDCNRIIISTEIEDEVHDGGKRAILPRNFPVTEIDSITIDGVALETDDYTLDRMGVKVRMKSGLPFAGGPGDILITYTGGYASIPGKLILAVKKVVALEYYLGPGRKALAKRSESTQGGSVTYERGPEDQEKIMRGVVRRYGRR
jgi:hypothetical protein